MAWPASCARVKTSFDRAVPVHQDDGRRAIGARRVGAGALALRLVDVHPALLETGPQIVDVVGRPGDRRPSSTSRRPRDSRSVAPVPGTGARRGHTAPARRAQARAGAAPGSAPEPAAPRESRRSGCRRPRPARCRRRAPLPGPRGSCARGRGRRRRAPTRRATPPACAGDRDRPS